ncbi:hypothetical protein BDZ91DRAFT_656370 [Kalaharituber pfeilii]|nr:hypothetical protein BDZ91DRAFT_656370 [Kalaharituber pfeilii]
MPSIRNPFRRAPQLNSTAQLNGSTESFVSNNTTETPESSTSRLTDSFHGSSILGRPFPSLSLSTDSLSKTSTTQKSSGNSSAVSIVRGKVEENAGEFKLSVVNDSGVYLPPSPTEHKSFWKRNGSKSTPPIDRTSLDEPFTISRESLESYRRSFDISARSPVIDPGRRSLDTRPRPSFEKMARLHPPVKIEEAPSAADDGLEEIKLDDTKPKKRGIFSMFGGDSTTPAPTPVLKFTSFKRDNVETIQESELKRIQAPEKKGLEVMA